MSIGRDVDVGMTIESPDWQICSLFMTVVAFTMSSMTEASQGMKFDDVFLFSRLELELPDDF